MPKPGERKTVQARILAYAESIGWTFVSRKEAEQRRGFDPQITHIPAESESRENNLRSSAKSADKSLEQGRSYSLIFSKLRIFEHYSADLLK